MSIHAPIANSAVTLACIVQGDGIALKQLVFTKGEKLYCFEMKSLSELTASITKDDPWAPSAADSHTPSTTNDHTHQQRSENDTNIDAFGSEPFVNNSRNDRGGMTLDCALRKINTELMLFMCNRQIAVQWRWMELL